MELHFHFLIIFTLYITSQASPLDIILPDISLPPMSALPPTSGGEFRPGPSRNWNWVPGTPSPAPDSNFPVVPKETTPASPSPSGSGMPFISSNPAVPLPTGVTDTASILPLPTPGDRNQVTGLGSVVRADKAMLVSAVVVSAALVLWV